MKLRNLLPGLGTTPETELENKFIKPHVWEGKLKVDGKYGPKEKILDFVERLKNKGLIAVDPSGDWIEDEVTGITTPSDSYYLVRFIGHHFHLLKKLIRYVNGLGCEQEYDLYSFFLSKQDKKQNLFRVQISVSRDKNFTIEVFQGDWVPSFEKQKKVAGWTG